MTSSRRVIAAVAAAAVMPAFAGEVARGDVSPAQPPKGWEFALTAYPTIVRGGENYTSAIATADRGPLHLEARYSYESIGARSAFIGWNLSGGETITWQLTPLAGGAWGSTRAFVPGFEASLGWRRLDFYIEAEYVRESGDRSASYLYAWSELGLSPVEWLRFGLAVQRTRAYGGDRDIQRGPFAQFTWGRLAGCPTRCALRSERLGRPGALAVGGYWFNPGSSEQVFVGMLGLSW